MRWPAPRAVGPGRRGPAVVVVLAAAGLTALAAAGAAAGPVTFGQPRWSVLRTGDETSPAPGTAPAAEQDAGAERVLTLPGWLLPVLGVASVVVLAVLAHRLLRAGAARGTARPDGAGDRAEPAVAPSRLAAAARTAGPGAATRPAGARGDPRDEVVLAWCAVEDAAAAAGLPRRDVQTPSDFAAQVRTRLGAHDAAVARLLRLYHRARFSAAAMPPGSDAEARDAAATVAAGLRGPGRG